MGPAGTDFSVWGECERIVENLRESSESLRILGNLGESNPRRKGIVAFFAGPTMRSWHIIANDGGTVENVCHVFQYAKIASRKSCSSGVNPSCARVCVPPKGLRCIFVCFYVHLFVQFHVRHSYR